MGLGDQDADTTDQGAIDRDTQKKKANKDYVDKKFHARERDVGEGDWVLLEQKRQNKLSSSYEKEPYEVMARYGDQVVLMSSNGGEYRRNMHHIKPFNIPDHKKGGVTVRAWICVYNRCVCVSYRSYGTKVGDTYYNNSTTRDSKDVFNISSSGNTR